MKTLIAALLLTSSAVSAGTILPGTYVGDIDFLLDVTDTLPNSNKKTEQAYIQDLLGDPDIMFEVKDETVFATPTVEDPNVLAFALPTEDRLFIVKNAKFWAAYENVELLNWGVIDTALLPSDMNLSSTQLEISHVSMFSGYTPPSPPPPSVPIPATVWLFASGLLGMVGVGLRRKKV